MPSSQNEIEVSNPPPTPAPITGTVTALQGGAWSVAITNYPAVQPVSQFGTWNVNSTPQATANGGGSSTFTTSSGLVASAVVKSSAGSLSQFTVWNNAGAVRYIHVFDATAVPPNGTIPTIVIQMTATSSGVWNAGQFARPFTNGIVIALSSTATTLTLAAAAMHVDAIYK